VAVRFVRPSLSIELDGDRFPFEPGFLQAPAVYGRPVLRQWFHEVLHFWQTLSEGFVTNVALAEWMDLLAWEGGLEPPNSTAALRREFIRVHADLGFSSWNLHEALCRFWDIHVIGAARLLDPEWGLQPITSASEDFMKRVVESDSRGTTSDQFDSLMQEGDAYSGPYRYALARWDTRQCVTLFPIVGYFALQTASPVDVFTEAIERLAVSEAFESLRSIHLGWEWNYPRVRGECAAAAHRVTGRCFTRGWEVIASSGLSNHPIFAAYLERFQSTSFRSWGDDPDYIFALPGHPPNRRLLRRLFRPPLTLFHDGRWTAATPDTRLVEEYEDLADAAADIEGRYRAYEWARRRSRLEPESMLDDQRTERVSSTRETDRLCWTELSPGTHVDDLMRIWSDACNAGDWTTALMAWRHRHGAGTEADMKRIYALVNDGPDREELLAAAAEEGDATVAPYAAYQLGTLLRPRADEKKAEAAYRQAMNSGHPFYGPNSALALGKMLEATDPVGASEAYERAAVGGHSEIAAKALFNLGLLRTGSDVNGAIDAYRRSMDVRHWDASAKAAHNLGILLRDRGDLVGAKEAFQVVISLRHQELSKSAGLAIHDLKRRLGEA
jgi:tetratricopeptide (TPR) repeat protein